MTIRSQHGRATEELLRQHRQTLLESLVVGHKTKIYWRIVGQVQGIDDALRISDEADFKLNGDEPDGGS